MAEFAGTYKFEKDDGNFDALLSVMNVGFLIRKVAVKTTPTITISVKDDGTINVKTASTFKNSEFDFKIGVPFDQKRMDGVTVKCTITQEGNKLIEKQEADVPIELTREFTGDKLITTCKAKDVVCVREYKKV